MLDVTTNATVDRLLRRLVAFTPTEWAALDQSLATWFDAQGYRGEPPAAFRWLAERLASVMRALPLPPVVWRLLRDRILDRDGFTALAPAWRRQGTGPLRHLIEVAQRPDLPHLPRIWLPSVVYLSYERATSGGTWQAEFYAPLEPLIPWATIAIDAERQPPAA